MAEFRQPFPSLDIGRRSQWILKAPLLYFSNITNGLIVVSTGFETDLASIPKWVPRWVIDVNEEHRFAAIVHDYACRTWPLEHRHVADAVFKEAMAVLGVPSWKRWAMWAAVRGLTTWLRITR